MIRLVFLGRLADLAGVPERLLAADGPQTFAAIVAQLDPAFGDAKIKLALNGTLVARKGLMIAPGDELAFLPPVSGG